ncbi:Aminoacid dehydrogenase-like protein [Metschnikowia bicuspidata var. bicuspidata NRRL YB-4993]|uniref:Aminoacid dehydrogenase-like protein n=1 Tax=Metschnikowia bicuspidata var. bicuspidata NRRL YB-4993 TaxID=869754 RepID=A0A1A0H9N5_9ASCO|nr:Aminoacid dehydrogenase-like protein [Metschnikowia bicuspidata var. bicuspidata NRRL YB-4993]OBA20839.1 Aminoacid dehydrogenase-like protein [Metschnikowia bicuspidata var. bicuspidata NRRL YB-4993]
MSSVLLQSRPILKSSRLARFQSIAVKPVSAAKPKHTHTIKTPVGVTAALAALKPKTTRLSIEGPIECDLQGFQLLNSPIFNKGSAFTVEERAAFGLDGLLPSKVNSLDEQVDRAYTQFKYLKTPLAKNDFCRSMRLQNKVLYYELVRRNIREMLPIIYTPTEGDAISNYSHRFRKPEGCFLDITQPETIDERLAAFGEAKDIDYIVVSDGEGILGIGDQGVGGVNISSAKLGLMTLCAGIHPGRTLPVILDVGTNNKELQEDELYMGNKFPRVRGEEYWSFVDKFIKAVRERFPSAVVHYEDFGVTSARTMLHKYREFIPSFNDDIQGTGAVVMASITAALKFSNRELLETSVLIYGAGSAGLGIADQIVNHMCSHGSSVEDACKKIHIMDRRGVVLQSYKDSPEGQLRYADPDSEWTGVNVRSLKEAVAHVKPTVLVGCSTQAGAFTEDVIKEMYKHNPQPIVFPLSNPTRLHEAFPVDIMKWTDNKALVATGSPFQPVDGYQISENNNCFTFPGIGLGAVLSRCTTITDTMISAGVDQLASMSPKMDNPKNGLLPRLEEINEVSAHVATAIILQSLKEGIARVESEERPDGGFVEVPRDFQKCLKWVKSQMWRPNYRPLVKVQHVPEIHTHQY